MASSGIASSAPVRRPRRRRLRGSRALLYAVAIAGLALMTGPLLMMVSTSLMAPSEVLAYPPRLLPADPQWGNYPAVFEQVPFLRYMVNSLIVATAVTIGSLILHSMAGYSLARLRYPGRNALFIAILATMMVPFTVLIVPLAIIVRELGWINSYAGLIIPLLPNAYGIFLFRQFYLSLPRELEEAAVVDGASHLQVFRKVAVPLSAPVFVALGALYFLANWNLFLWPLIVSRTRDMWLVQVGVQQFTGAHRTQWNLIMAASVIALIPVLLLYFFLQRRMVEGVKLSGLRG
jgi:multiple sugar transport system permease protein